MYSIASAALLCGVMVTSSLAADVDYERHIKPLLAAKCAACHGALKQEANLRLDAGALIRRGGNSGAVVKPGDADASELIARVTAHDDQRMPPEGEGELLLPDQVKQLRGWIASGARYPADEAIPPSPREHWAYRPPVRGEIPKVKNGAWQANPIDAFLASKWEEQGVLPVTAALPHVVLRRIHLNLVGLPPTPAEIAQFEAKVTELRKGQVPADPFIPLAAIAATIDDLLARPAHGEHWGRHWMDVWRYSDWSGYGQEVRRSQRHIWHWRDWIVESINDDKPYDQMVREMLAGDELAPTDAQMLRATGFLARNWHKSNRNVWLDDTVEHTAKAFLGATINCAKCHDHKYDPLAQPEYYELRAVFEPHEIRADAILGQADLTKNSLPRAFDQNLSAPTYLFERGDEKQPRKDRPIKPALSPLLGGQFNVEPISLPVEAYYPALRGDLIEGQLTAAREDVKTAETKLQKLTAEEARSPAAIEAKLRLQIAQASLALLEARIAVDRDKYLKAGESLAKLAPLAAKAERTLSAIQAELALHQAETALAAAKRKAADQPSEKMLATAVTNAEKSLEQAKKKRQDALAALEKPGDKYTPLGKEYPRTSSGRRLALARAITARSNPLAARVAVNHIWLRHFGTPLVENVFDFGLRSPRPRQAELLDWLAVELMENSWQMKRVHHLIVSSRAYQLSSSLQGASPTSLQADADNRLYWRMNSRRLEAEAVRDGLLFVAGSLDATRGGPEIDRQQAMSSRRRSIYLQHAYEKKAKFLELFDSASETDCYRRNESIIPQQALALANSPLANEQSRILAGKLMAELKLAKDSKMSLDERFVRQAFITVLARPPLADEMAACLEFLTQQTKRLGGGKLSAIAGGPKVDATPSADLAQRARENLVHVLMNHNDFVTIR